MPAEPAQHMWLMWAKDVFCYSKNHSKEEHSPLELKKWLLKSCSKYLKCNIKLIKVRDSQKDLSNFRNPRGIIFLVLLVSFITCHQGVYAQKWWLALTFSILNDWQVRWNLSCTSLYSLESGLSSTILGCSFSIGSHVGGSIIDFWSAEETWSIIFTQIPCLKLNMPCHKSFWKSIHLAYGWVRKRYLLVL